MNKDCTFFLAPEDPDAMAQIERWSKEYDIPLEFMGCRGCRHHNGQISVQTYLYGRSHRCAAYECSKSKGHHLCGDCEEFPCDNLHPYVDKANTTPHNIKVFNLCQINKMGLKKWAESKASEVRNT